MGLSQAGVWIDALPMAALFIDLNERILAINSEAISVLGQGFTGRSYISALRQPDALTCVETCFRDKGKHSTKFRNAESLSDVTYDLRCQFVNGEEQGVLVTFTDVTEAQKTSQMHRDFVANVSHELRTPLTALMGFIETLQGPAQSDQKAQQRFLGIMASETARMNRLVDDLLSLSRVESQERQQPKDEIDIAALLNSVVTTFTQSEQASEASVSLDIATDLHQVHGDHDQLCQVFSNLIENAIKYGGDDVAIVVNAQNAAYDTRLRSPALRIRVRDNGIGFDDAHSARLTERFYRIDSHRSREMGGTGLGLAIVKHIISRHRGRMEISSKPLQGSDFTVFLPALS